MLRGDAMRSSSLSLSCFYLWVLRGCLLFLSVATAAHTLTAQAQSVLTHHNDNLRTGWNSHETTLTPTNVPSLQHLASVSLDEQVDAQPLLVPGQNIVGQGTHNVVYVATENDTVYAIDAASGSILLSKNFGPPVPLSAIPFQCPNNSQNVGITSTPVIDPASSTMYVMVYSYENGAPAYRLHALELSTLSDKVPPAVVSASIKLPSGGPVYNFDPAVSRQRSALLEANGNIYAAFASFCDFSANKSRGWLLGWRAGSLTPVPGSQLDDLLATSPDNFFLSSIWMSGNGVAADSLGNLYFSTGNSDPGTYSNSRNLSESIVKMNPTLQNVIDFFTPSNRDVGAGCVFDSNPGVQCLDRNDGDVSAGGVLLLPDQAGFPAGLAVAAGKFGPMYLLNRSNLGGFSKSGNDQVLGTFDIGFCWCGESYFTGPDGKGRVVSSGGGNIIVWKVQTAPNLTLVTESTSPPLTTGQDPGFFTSVSSNGTQNPIIWAVGRPVDASPANVTLYAFDPVTASLLFSSNPGDAGTWPNTGGNANIVPVAANGHVYVASFKQLSIFGLAGSAAAQPQTAQTAPQTATQSVQTAAVVATQLSANEHQIFGTITTVNADLFTIKTRTGALVNVDATQAVQEYASVLLLVGEPVRILGSYNTSDVLQATSVARAKPSPALWPPDQ
jgi:hypothetical protein